MPDKFCCCSNILIPVRWDSVSLPSSLLSFHCFLLSGCRPAAGPRVAGARDGSGEGGNGPQGADSGRVRLHLGGVLQGGALCPCSEQIHQVCACVLCCGWGWGWGWAGGYGVCVLFLSAPEPTLAYIT